MGFSISIALYQLTGRARNRDPSRLTPVEQRANRPAGSLIWIHAPHHNDHGAICELINQLTDQYPDLWVLFTTLKEPPQDLPGQCFHQVIPPDTGPAATEFISYWHPDLIIWVSGELFPMMTNAAANAQIPQLLLDTGGAFDASVGRWYLSGLVRRTLRKFDAILSGDEATSLALISAGAHISNVRTTGVLELGNTVLPCNEVEWELLSELVATRPVWLAVNINPTDLSSIIVAQGQALRRSHKLLMIISPASLGDEPEIAKTLEQQNIQYARRSKGQEPTQNVQVYLTDDPEEIGLWYRLAPVTFMGQTANNRDGERLDPFNAATLGSVVIHGPNTTPYNVAYSRLERAGASYSINHLGELARALDTVLAPDRAALMAHAAWQISTAGAEVMVETLNTIEQLMQPSSPSNPESLP